MFALVRMVLENLLSVGTFNLVISSGNSNIKYSITFIELRRNNYFLKLVLASITEKDKNEIGE